MPGPHDQGWQRIVCCASGPSFTQAQADMIEAARVAGRCKVIAVNTTALTRMPNADAMIAADPPWWTEHIKLVRQTNIGQLWTSSDVAASEHGLRLVGLQRTEGLCRDVTAINSGGNSGYQAIGLAYLFGACCIALVGYDMQWTGGKSHHHGNHPGRMHNAQPAALKAWAKRFAPLVRDLEAEGVGVINCTAQTLITCIDRVALDAILGPP